MDNSTPLENKKHNITLNNGKLLSLDGVLEVRSFDDALILLDTHLGELSIEGSALRITKYIMQTGEMCVEGFITALIYSPTRQEDKKGFFSILKR